MRLFFLSLAICFCQAISGQAYYYFVYEAPPFKGVSHTYKSLLTLQPDGTGTARIQYKGDNENEFYLYEISLKDSVTGSPDSIFRSLISYKEAEPLIKEDTAGFRPPRFIFKKGYDSSGYFYTPDRVEIKEASGAWEATKLTTNQQKSFRDLRNDEPFMSSFYFV